MIIRNATAEQLYKAVRQTAEDYEGNVRFKNGPDPVNQKGTGHRLTLTVHASSKPGGRRSNTGRKIAAACWHVHREFMRHLYDIAPEAVIQSALATYRGVQDFEETFEATGDGNIGSAFEPQAMRTACECEENDNGRAQQANYRAMEDAERRMNGVHEAAASYNPLAEAQRNVEELTAKVAELKTTIANETEDGPYYNN
jgi:hypothetical protein